MEIFCKVIGHRRSKKGARRRGDVWLSNCSTCGEPLHRSAQGQWEPGHPDLDPSQTLLDG